MRIRLEEELLIFASIIKWLILASIAGSLTGVLASCFIIANVCDLDLATFSAIGFVSLLAGTTNTPISMSIMAIEMFGAEIAPYAAVACILSFLMSGHRSLYSSQVLTLSKTRSLIVEAGKEMHEIKTEVNKDKNIYQSIFKYLRFLLKRVKDL